MRPICNGPHFYFLRAMREKKIISVVLIFLALFLCLGVWQAKTFLRADEFFYFNSAKAMVESGDWLTPQHFENIRFQKPILFYWLIALGFKLFGINWFAARLASILFGLGIICLTFLIARQIFDRKSAILSVFILTTIPFTFRFFRLALPEAMLTFFITLAFFIFLKLISRDAGSKSKALWISLGLALGLSFLTKGPVGIIIFLAAFAFFIFWSKQKISWGGFSFSLGLALILGLSWYAYLHFKYGAEFWNFIIATEVNDRMCALASWSALSKIFEYFKHLPVYFFASFVDLLPWSVLAPWVFIQSFRKRGEQGGVKFLFCWIISVLLIYSFVFSRHSHYILPLTPAFAILTASYICSKKKLFKISAAIIIIMYLGFLGYITYSFSNLGQKGGYDYFAAEILQSFQPGERVAIGSHKFVEQSLEAYLGQPVEKQCGNWRDISDQTDYDWNKRAICNFLNSNQRVYMIIKKEDFFAYTDKDFRDNLQVLAKGYIIKRHPRFSNLFKEDYKKTFYDEVWLISNQ